MNSFVDCWRTLRRYGLQRSLRSLAQFKLVQRSEVLLCILTLFVYHVSGEHHGLRVTTSCIGARIGCHAKDVNSQHLQNGLRAPDMRMSPSQLRRSHASAYLQRVLFPGVPSGSFGDASRNRGAPAAERSDGDVSIDTTGHGDNREGNGASGDGGPSSGGSNNSINNLNASAHQPANATHDTPGSSSTSPPPQQQPLQAHPQHQTCSYDRVTAPEPGHGCGLDKTDVEFDAVLLQGDETSLTVDNTSSHAVSRVDGISTLRMCANHAAYSSETGKLSFALCWLPGDPPDELLAAAAAAMRASLPQPQPPFHINPLNTSDISQVVVLRVTLPQLSLYGISSMAPGNYSLRVSGVDAVRVVVHHAASNATNITSSDSAGDVFAGIGLALSDPSTLTNVSEEASEAVARAENHTIQTAVPPPPPPPPPPPRPMVTVPVGGAAAMTLQFEMRQCTRTDNPSRANLDGSSSTDISTTSSVRESSSSGGNSGSSSSNSSDQSGVANSGPRSLNPIPHATASRLVSVLFTGPPNPPPASATCKCAEPAAAATATGSSCPDGFVTLTATIASAPISPNRTVTNGTSSTLFAALDTPNPSDRDGVDGQANGDAIAPFVQCVPQPLYDTANRRFTFSTCWRYACLPDAFTRRPYELLFGPMSYAAVAALRPPAGTHRLTTLMPNGCGLSYEYRTAAGEPWQVAVAAPAGASAGASTDRTELVTLPYLGNGQIRIRVQVPFDMDVDNAGGSLELQLVSAADSSSGTGSSSWASRSGGVVLTSPDGGAMVLPPVPSGASAENATLVVVSELWLSRKVGAGGGSGNRVESAVSELAEMVRQGLAANTVGINGPQQHNISVNVSLLGFRMTLPLQFRDFSVVRDCSSDSLTSLSAATVTALQETADVVAAQTSGSGTASPVSLSSVGCSYGAYTGGRRRHLQHQQQPQETCTVRLNTPVAVDTPPLDLDAFLSNSSSMLSSTYGGSMCSMDPSSPEVTVISKLAMSVSMPAALVVTSSIYTTASTSSGSATVASAQACTAGAQTLVASLGLSDGEATIVECKLSAEASPNIVPQLGPGIKPASSGSGARAGDNHNGARFAGIIAASASAAGLMVVFLGAMLVKMRRRSRDSRFFGSEASTGQRTFDNISSMSMSSDNGKALGEENAFFRPPTSTPSTDGKQRRFARQEGANGIGNSGGSRGSAGVGVGGTNCLESTAMLPSSSKSLKSYTARPCSSVYGSECATGGGGSGGVASTVGGNERRLLSIMTLPSEAATVRLAAAAAASPAVSRLGPSQRCSTDGAVRDGFGDVGPTSSHAQPCPDPLIRRRAFHWAPDSLPGDASDSDDNKAYDIGRDGSNTPLIESCCNSGDAGPNSTARGSAGPVSRLTGGSLVSVSGITAGGMYDLFGFEGAMAEAAGGTAGAICSASPARCVGSRTSGSGGGTVSLAAAAARRRNDDDGAHMYQRSDAGHLTMRPVPSSSQQTFRRDDVSGDGGSKSRHGSAFLTSSSPWRTDLAMNGLAAGATRSVAAAAAAATTAASSPHSVRSTRKALPPLHLNFALPGAEWYGSTEDSDSPYDGVLLGAGLSPPSIPGDFLIEEAADHELLRVQSRRPAFLDRTGGSLAAAVAATVTSPQYSGGGESATFAGGISTTPPLSDLRNSSTSRVEPRRGGFVRRSSVTPYVGSPSSYTSYLRMRNCAGSATAAIGNRATGAGGYEAWPAAAAAAAAAALINPCELAEDGRTIFVGVIAGPRRSIGYESTGRGSGSTAGANDDLEQAVITTYTPRHHPPVALPPSSPPPASSAPQWTGSLSWRSRSKSKATVRRPACTNCDVQAAGLEVALAADGGVGGVSGSTAPATAATGYASTSEDSTIFSRYKIQRPPCVQTSGALGFDTEFSAPQNSAQRAAAADGGVSGAVSGSSGSGCGGDDTNVPSSRSAAQGEQRCDLGCVGATAASGRRPSGDQLQLQPWPSPESVSIPAPKSLPQLLQLLRAVDGVKAHASGAAAERTLGSSSSARPPEPLSVNRFAGHGYGTAPVSPLNHGRHSPIGPDNNTSGSISGDGSADGRGVGGGGGRRRVEELSPAFGPSPSMRARQLVKRSSSCGSSNDDTPYGMGGLVDPVVEANAESGAMRLEMIKRLAVGPPRPAWGLVHAGVRPLKRSIASVQHVKSIRKIETGLVPTLTPAVPAAAAAAAQEGGLVPAGPSITFPEAAPHSSVPGRLLLSGGSSATGCDGGGGGDVSFVSSEASGPFLRLVPET